MKKSVLIIIFFLLSQFYLFGQDKYSFIDSILNLVSLNQISIYDEDYTKLNNQTLLSNLSEFDTIVNCSWTRPRYVDNLYRKSVDGVIIKRELEFDTISNLHNNQYLVFFEARYSDIDEFKYNKFIFQIDKGETLKSHKNNQDTNKKIIASRPNYWTNNFVFLSNKKNKLDSCHLLYRLELNKDNSFKQYFSDGSLNCFTNEMAFNTNVGVEGNAEEFWIYHNKIQGHYIENGFGNWIILENKLTLYTSKGRKIVTYEIIEMSEKKLILKFNDYTIELIKKASR